MVMFKTPKDVKDLEKKVIYKAGEEFEMTLKRADEFVKNIRSHKGYEEFELERVEAETEEGE